MAQPYGKLASKCQLFSNERYGYVPVYRFGINHGSPHALLQFYTDIGSEDQFRRMIVLDALILNVDRHVGNHGVLMDNERQTPICMAPVFDLNLTLIPYLNEEDLRHFDAKPPDYKPKIGDDFIRMGQQALTPAIRETLNGLRGFRFSFRGNDDFSPERVI